MLVIGSGMLYNQMSNQLLSLGESLTIPHTAIFNSAKERSSSLVAQIRVPVPHVLSQLVFTAVACALLTLRTAIDTTAKQSRSRTRLGR